MERVILKYLPDIEVECPHCDESSDYPFEEFEEIGRAKWIGTFECDDCGKEFEAVIEL